MMCSSVYLLKLCPYRLGFNGDDSMQVPMQTSVYKRLPIGRMVHGHVWLSHRGILVRTHVPRLFPPGGRLQAWPPGPGNDGAAAPRSFRPSAGRFAAQPGAL